MQPEFTIDKEYQRQMKAAFDRMEKKLPLLIERLLNLGWYPPFDQFTLRQLDNWCTEIDSAQDGELENALVNFAREMLPHIPERLKSAWPGRSQIIEDAYAAHLAGKFNLVIPVLLTQADGISSDVIGGNLFTSRDKRLRSDTALDALLSTFSINGKMSSGSDLLNADFLALRSPSALHTDTRTRGSSVKLNPGTPLNRHGVLHGIDVDYGNEANALRVWVLLNYLQSVMTRLDYLAEAKKRWDEMLREDAESR